MLWVNTPSDDRTITMTSKHSAADSPAVSTLRRWGVPAPVARAARDAALAENIPLARLIAVAEFESGFQNIWGHDAGKWREDGPLTRDSVRRYFAQPASRRPNGAGVWQLTWPGYQAWCEEHGGLHDVETQGRAAARVLASLPNRGADAGGLSRYNGTGPAARGYGLRVHAREWLWASRLVSGR